MDADSWLWVGKGKQDFEPDYAGLLAEEVERASAGDAGRRALLQFVADRLLDGVRVRKATECEMKDGAELLKRAEAARGDSTFAAGMECERFRPHVLLVDVHMDEQAATQFCSWLRSNDDFAGTRLIAMSNRLTDGQVPALTQSGWDGTLRKPFTVRQLIESIESANALVY